MDKPSTSSTDSRQGSGERSCKQLKRKWDFPVSVEEQVCRICLESSDAETSSSPIVAPCACRGSAKFVHIKCIQKWHSRCPISTNVSCPTCKQAYVGDAALAVSEANVRCITDALTSAQQTQGHNSLDNTQMEEMRAVAQCHLAHELAHRGRWEEAIQLVNETISTWDRLKDRNAPQLIGSLNSMLTILSGQARYGEALAVALRLCSLIKAKYGKCTPMLATSLNAVGVLLSYMGKFNKAEPYYRKALAIRKSIFGENHLDVAESFNNLGAIMNNQQRYEDAEKLYTRSYEIRASILGHNHPHTATCLNNIAALYKQTGDLESSKQLYKQALKLRTDTYGEKHPICIESLNNLGDVLKELGEMEEAELVAKQALDLCKDFYSELNLKFLGCKGNYAVILQHRGKYNEAKEQVEETLAGLQKLGLPSTHAWVENYTRHRNKMLEMVTDESDEGKVSNRTV